MENDRSNHSEKQVSGKAPTARKMPPGREFWSGNQYTQRRLVAAVLTAPTLRSAARKLGGAEVLLGELKREFGWRTPALARRTA